MSIASHIGRGTSRALLWLAGASVIGHAQPGAATVRSPAAGAERIVRFSVATRPGLCGGGEGNVFHGTRTPTGWTPESSRYWESERDCGQGPMRVVLEQRGSEVVRVRFYIGGRWRATADGEDLGDVAGDVAVRLLRAAIDGPNERAAKDAMVPLAFIDGIAVAPVLLPVARDASRPREVRKQAVFWLAQAAQEQVAPQLGAIADDDPDLELRKHAVFALSQRPTEEAVPALIRIADSKAAPEVRRQAIFWLGQKDDPRVTRWLEARLAAP